MTNYTTNNEYQISHAIQLAWQSKPAPTTEPAIRKLDNRRIGIYKQHEYRAVKRDYLENEVKTLEERVTTLEDRLN